MHSEGINEGGHNSAGRIKDSLYAGSVNALRYAALLARVRQALEVEESFTASDDHAQPVTEGLTKEASE